MSTETIILIVLAVLAVILFGLGFVVKWIFIGAAIVLIVLAVEWLILRARRA